jgi:acetyl-CoA C-acetyltransferase
VRNVVIIESVRTPIGSLGGALGNETVDALAAIVMNAVMARANVDKELVDEVLLGQAKQSADQSNLARYAILKAGFPKSIPGMTIHRQCGSGLQTINSAAQQIICGYSDVIIAGGAESMSTAPYYVNQVRFGTGAGNIELKDPNTASQPGSQPVEHYGVLNMGLTAENIAKKYKISREEQDEFALSSQEKAKAAIQSGIFATEIVPYEIKKRKETIVFDTDEHPRATSLEKLAKLKPVFKQGGTVTAGNASGRNDGASALLVMGEDVAEKHGLKPKARIVTQAVAGCEPTLMGMGPVYSTRKALAQANLTINDIDVIELNEAFAAQAISCIKELGADSSRVNPNGGAIALGHPIGATGAILMTKVINELTRTDKKYGLVTLCIAGGMGITTIIENTLA